MYSLAEKETLDMVICGLTYVDEGGKELNKIIPGVYKRLENEEWTFIQQYVPIYTNGNCGKV